MPPRSSLTGSFAVANEQNEVVCPLKNNDGTLCRKRCFGEKRFRSMQEHIRRAHPDHYISKLPATEESFNLMINTDPKDRPQNQTTSQQYGASNFLQDPSSFYDHNSAGSQHHLPPADHLRRPSFVPAANAAAALAQLHNSRPDSGWDVDRVRRYDGSILDENKLTASQHETFHEPEDDHNFPNYFAGPDPHNIFSNPQPPLSDPSRHSNLLPAEFPPSSSSRGASLQPFTRHKPTRPRKSSIAENARRGKHERRASKEEKRLSGGRKTGSLEPGKRWEDLLDAAASATEEESRDLTPIPPSPRGSIPPYQGQNHNQYHSYNTSPLQHTMLPQSPEEQSGETAFGEPSLDAFPSVESSTDYSQVNPPSAGYQHHHNSSANSSISNPFGYPRSHQQQSSTGSNFHIPPSGLSSSPNELAAPAASYGRQGMHAHSYSQPSFPTQVHGSIMQRSAPHLVRHWCAACGKASPVQQSYACTECICGICRECADVLLSMTERGSRCPKCSVGAKFKPIMLNLQEIA